MTLELDHVVLAVDDLDEAADRLWDEHGLASVPGGRHPGHGTANRIIPLDGQYIELVAVVEPREAASSPFGSWIARRASRQGEPVGICLNTGDITAISTRLGLAVVPMSRVRPDGAVLRWRLAGLDIAIATGLPFFIQWDNAPNLHPAAAAAHHRVQPVGISWLEIGGEPARLEAWLGTHELPLRLIPDRSGLQRIAIASANGELIIPGR